VLAVGVAVGSGHVAGADDAPRFRAQVPLEIHGEGGETWDSILREVQETPGTSGRAYALGVRSASTTYGCDDYVLSFDDVGRAAFTSEGCDPRTGMTRIRVTSRSALFDERGFVPRPRRASVYAVLVEHAQAEGGGARPEGGSRVACSVRLEPYLWDSLHGVAVPLPWDRFEVRPLSEDVHAAPDGAGWIARGTSHMSVRFRYQVVDRKTRETVLDDEATLVCDDKPTSATTTHDDPIAPTPAPVSASVPPVVSEGSTAAASGFRDHSVGSLKLRVVELTLLRNDTERFRGALQLGPYNGANDFAGGLQIGITNTAGAHPWGLPTVLASHRKGGGGVEAVVEPDASGRSQAFRGLAQIGVINAVGDDFTGALQVGGVVTFVEGSFHGFAQIGAFGAGMGAHSVAAIQFGGFVAYAKDLSGIQVSPCIAAAGRIRGIQIGACATIATGSVEGLQIGAENMVFETTKRGETAIPATVDGAQVGGWNFTSVIHGAQVGAINIGVTVHGVQIGAINYATHLRGFQIGAINIAANGVVPFMPVMNAAFDG
jgi:hypothetical protein